MSDPKIQDLEIALAHHEQQIADLSEMVEKQWKEIDRMKLRLEAALNKISELETSSRDASGKPQMSVAEIAASEKPPHY